MSGSLTALKNVDIIVSGERLGCRTIVIGDGKIVDIVDAQASLVHCSEIIDFQGNLAVPGLIDLQIYGAGGLLFGGDPTIEALEMMERELVQQGVTGFLATIATNTSEVVSRGIETAQKERVDAIGNFWGLHLEGPYLNASKRGAHPEHLIRTASLGEAQELIDQAKGCITMMTIAPEKVPVEVTELFHSAGVVLSAGHSNASYAEGKGFINHPVRTVTHLFNAMPSLHHRDLGFTLAVLEDRPYASIVVDGIHVAYPMVRLAKQLLGDKLFLITDAVTSCSTGIYPHILHDGDRYVMPDGTLSGSALTLLTAVRNCVNHCEIPLAEAINMATLYPAEVLGVSHKKGKVAIGYDADICILDANLQPVATFIAGELVYRIVVS